MDVSLALSIIAILIAIGSPVWQVRVTEKRQNLKNEAWALCELLEQVEVAAYKYYALPGSHADCPALASTIVIQLKQIGGRVSRLSTSSEIKIKLSAMQLRFKRAVTLMGFQDITRNAYDPLDPALDEISRSSGFLARALNLI